MCMIMSSKLMIPASIFKVPVLVSNTCIQLPYTASKMSTQVEKPSCSAFKESVE